MFKQHTDDLGPTVGGLHVVVDDVEFELSRDENLSIDVCHPFLVDDRQPHVELVDPVLERVHRDDDEGRSGFRVPQEYVDERDDLDGLAETHAVREDATEPVARLEPVQRFNDVVVKESDSTNLEHFH